MYFFFFSPKDFTAKQMIQLALTTCCINGSKSFATVRLLLTQYGAKANITSGHTPHCDPRVCDLLPLCAVSLSIDPDHEACYQVAKELIAHGADPMAMTNSFQLPMLQAIETDNVRRKDNLVSFFLFFFIMMIMILIIIIFFLNNTQRLELFVLCWRVVLLLPAAMKTDSVASLALPPATTAPLSNCS